jgi:hypothetical protein
VAIEADFAHQHSPAASHTFCLCFRLHPYPLNR